MANVLSMSKRTEIVTALVEGNSLRATARMADVSRNTVNKLLLELGAACARFQNEAIKDVASKRVQVDELWSFVGAKAKNVPAERKGEFGVGDVWTYVAIDADTKLTLSFMVGTRDTEAASAFLIDVEGRLANRVQLTTDGHRMYLSAVESAFGTNVDFAQIQKVYGTDKMAETRYSPAVCIGCETTKISGRPDPAHINTSYVERQNLTMRMHIRRFTRLTNAFSKKLEQHCAAIALHFAYVNWVRIHQTLRVTPAMAAGLATQPWKVENLLALLPPVQYSGGRGRVRVSK